MVNKGITLEDLQHQLEVKDKIIGEILDFSLCNYCCSYECFYDEEQNECEKVKKLCGCNTCQETDKECWLKYFENEVLERGKNVNSK